jgi:hypothetical protein
MYDVQVANSSILADRCWVATILSFCFILTLSMTIYIGASNRIYELPYVFFPVTFAAFILFCCEISEFSNSPTAKFLSHRRKINAIDELINIFKQQNPLI